MKAVKLALVGGVALFGATMLSSQAQAQLATCPFTVVGGNLVGLPVLVEDLVPCQQEDKIYSNFDTNLPDDWEVTISTVFLPLGDQHSLAIRPPDDFTPGPFNFTFDYTIAIDPLVLNRIITIAGMDVDQTGGMTVTKDADGDATDYQLQSVNGNSDTEFGLNERTINVSVTITGDANTTLTSITDIYFQRNTDIPVVEPASMILFGAGLAGLGLAARRRRAA